MVVGTVVSRAAGGGLRGMCVARQRVGAGLGGGGALLAEETGLGGGGAGSLCHCDEDE